MSTGFDAVHAQIDKDLEARSSQSDDKEQTEPQGDLDTKGANQDLGDKTRKVSEAIFDLDKAEKFRFDGKDMTRKEFDAYIMRQKDYTEKTQRLAEERRTYESQREQERQENQKFEKNLFIDIENVRRNPALAGEFIKVYPERYHSYLKDALGINSQATQGQGQSSQPQIPIELMSQVQKLESFVHAQEVAKAEVDIESNLTKVLSAHKYASRKEVLADAYELHNRGTKLTSDVWTKIAEDSHNARKAEFDLYYKELQKEQTKANSKSRDVGAGGGTPGAAPKQKFDPKKGFGALNKEVYGEITRDRN